jgi:hypothetical protein
LFWGERCQKLQWIKENHKRVIGPEFVFGTSIMEPKAAQKIMQL